MLVQFLNRQGMFDLQNCFLSFNVSLYEYAKMCPSGSNQVILVNKGFIE